MKRTLKRVGIVVVAIIVSATALVVLAGRKAVPLRPIPPQKLPRPNAFDTYLKAYDEAYDNDKTEFGLMPAFAMTTREVKVAAGRNLPTVALIHEAFTQQCVFPSALRGDVRDGHSSAKIRSLSRILSFEGRSAETQGRWDDALAFDIDACRMGSDVAHGQGLIGGLVDYACQSVGRRSIWHLADIVSDAAARNGARRLYAIASNETPAGVVAREDAWDRLAYCEELFHTPNWRNAYDADSTYTGRVSRWAEFRSKFELAFLSPHDVEENAYRYATQEANLAELPYPQYLRAPRPVVPRDPVNRFLAYVPYDFTRFQREECVALDYLLAAELAIRAYRLERGGYPASLPALVPAYLPSVPVDPFTDHQPLRYRLTGTGYLLYSVGPDAKDNGGRPIDDPSQPKLRRHEIFSDSVGDIVAGTPDLK